MTPRRELRRSITQAAREMNAALREPVLLVWALYMALVPIYLWKSGLPQIGDILIIVMAPMALRRWGGRVPPTFVPALRGLLFFTIYVVLVDLAWSVFLNAWHLNLKKGFGLSPAFYIYNALVFLIVIVLHPRYKRNFLWFTAKVVLLSLIIQLVAGFILPSGIRATVLFNNPNQLGYYALLSMSILLLLQGGGYVSSLEIAIAGVAGGYLALISASKAALGGIGMLVIAGVFVRLRTMIIVLSVFGLTMLTSNPMQEAIEHAQSRVENDQSYGFFEERGYDRITQNPEYWIFGSGEGAYSRFAETTTIGDHEIHSSLGTLFFCYGIVGTLLFASFMWLVLRGSGLRVWLLVAPNLAYGMTHQGLRFTLFWVMLALVIAMRDEKLNGVPR